MDDCIQLRELTWLVRLETKIDDLINTLFPLLEYGDPLENLLVHGSKSLMIATQLVHAEKYDIVETLENMQVIGFMPNNQIILTFKSDESDFIICQGIYNFTNDFLRELFHIDKFASWCLEQDFRDIVLRNLRELFSNFKDLKKQYRLVKKEDNFYIRAMTSGLYNNYDNRLALYITLLTMHRYSKESGSTFSVTDIFMTESSMRVFFEQSKPVHISGFGKITMGLFLSNGEIRDRRLTLEARYSIDDLELNISFSLIPPLKEAIIEITHSLKPDNAKLRLEELSEIHNKQMGMLNFIEELSTTNLSDENTLHLIIKKIVNEKSLKAETHKNIQELWDQQFVENTYTIISILNDISTTTDDLDEKIMLERIYYKILKELVNNRKAK